VESRNKRKEVREYIESRFIAEAGCTYHFLKYQLHEAILYNFLAKQFNIGFGHRI
jgi:hypothetical protein